MRHCVILGFAPFYPLMDISRHLLETRLICRLHILSTLASLKSCRLVKVYNKSTCKCILKRLGLKLTEADKAINFPIQSKITTYKVGSRYRNRPLDLYVCN